ncbi:MAG: hypothetical protein ACR2MG_05785 [Pyrinomonadaceae bacterium]
MFYKKIISLLQCILLSGSVLAQTAPKTETKKTDISPEVQEKALSLLKGLARETEQFSLPLNRINARVIVADLLWDKDEKAARVVFQNAISDLNAMLGRIPPENGDADEEYNTGRYMMLADVNTLRKDLLIALAAYDAKFALDTLQVLTVKNSEGKSIFDDDQTLELDLAAKIAANDPKQAYELAKKNLESGLGISVFSTLESLYKKDAELGTRLARDILSKIKSKDTIINSPYDYAANANSNMMKVDVQNTVSMVNIWEIQLYLDSVKKLNRQAAKDKKPAVLSDGDVKELIDILAQKYIKQEYLSSYEVSKIMPEITKFFPAQAQAIRRKIGQQESSTLNNLVKIQGFQNEIEDKSADEILQIIEKKAAADRDDFYYQAAEAAFNNGDIEKADTFHSKIKTKREYDYLDKGINDALPLALAQKGDLREVRQALAKLKTPEERIEVLTTLAMSVAKSGDKKTAATLINEARSIYSGKMKNRRNLNSVFEMTQAYAVIEPDQGFGLLEANTQFFNDIINAAILLDEFNESGAVENDELRLDTVRRESYQNMPKGVQLIRNLTAADFDRTINFAERFARPEVRFYARYRIADALLNPDAEEDEKTIKTSLNEQEVEH